MVACGGPRGCGSYLMSGREGVKYGVEERAREEMRDNENGKLPHGRRPPRLFEASQRPVLLSPLVKTSLGQSLSLSLCDSAAGGWGGIQFQLVREKDFLGPSPSPKGSPCHLARGCVYAQSISSRPRTRRPRLRSCSRRRLIEIIRLAQLWPSAPPCWARTHVSGSRKILDFFVQCARRSRQHPQKKSSPPKFAPLWFSQTVLSVANANANADARSGPLVYSQLREGERAA